MPGEKDLFKKKTDAIQTETLADAEPNSARQTILFCPQRYMN